MTLDAGAQKALTVTEEITPMWVSSDESVATVTDGLVSAVATGKATIAASFEDATATCVVTVR